MEPGQPTCALTRPSNRPRRVLAHASRDTASESASLAPTRRRRVPVRAVERRSSLDEVFHERPSGRPTRRSLHEAAQIQDLFCAAKAAKTLKKKAMAVLP